MAPYDMDDPAGFLAFHHLMAQSVRQASGAGFEARYIVSLPRGSAVESYRLVRLLLDRHPELVPTVVGLDLCVVEEGHPPQTARDLFATLQADNQRDPERALEVVYHVGETFFDKSLESAVRWCHEAALLGARRLGHCLALSLDPGVAVRRRAGAHEAETAAERRDQIAYDLHHREALVRCGVEVDVGRLRAEQEHLWAAPDSALVTRPYTPARLEEVRRRQTGVLQELAERGTVVETCPTSNLYIGGVPAPADHPVRRFLASPADLVIGADDPGVFGSTLAAEVDWVARHGGLEPDALARRLGDPHRFRLATGRT
ncbi:MAG: hypothetical protein AB1505_13185 [Candidatus Latescibacterota bacterium]